jgi:hypothetical protein
LYLIKQRLLNIQVTGLSKEAQLPKPVMDTLAGFWSKLPGLIKCGKKDNDDPKTAEWAFEKHL